MIAYIPARGGSKRIPRKNIKHINGKPIIAYTIESLIKLDFIEKVYVSTDDLEIRDVAESFGAICLELRSPNLANDTAGFIDLIKKDLNRFCDESKSEEVLFVLPTAALVPSSIYIDAYKKYTSAKPEVLMSCEPFDVSPLWAMQQKDDGYWYPLFPEKVLMSSHDLPKILVDAGLFYFLNLSSIIKYSSLKLVDCLLPFEVPSIYRGDIDTPGDWEMMEEKFHKLENNNE